MLCALRHEWSESCELAAIEVLLVCARQWYTVRESQQSIWGITE